MNRIDKLKYHCSSTERSLSVEGSKYGYLYFGARYYEPDLSVWLSVDPLAGKYPNMSPYMYVRGNPVMLIDRWGLEGEKPNTSRLSFGKRIGNWFKGESWKNRTNKIIVKNNLYNVRFNKDGSVTATGSLPWRKSKKNGSLNGVNDYTFNFTNRGYSLTEHNSNTQITTTKVKGWRGAMVGVGFSFEIAFPKIVTKKLMPYTGGGIDFGIFRDYNGLGFYATGKYSTESGIAFSTQAEGFYCSSSAATSRDASRYEVGGDGNEFMIGIGPVGGSYSASNAPLSGRQSLYTMKTISIGPGIDLGGVMWNTKTLTSK